MFKKKEEIQELEEEINKKKKELENMPEPKEEEKEEPIFKVGQVSTASEPIIFNSKTEEQFTIHGALVKIMNDIETLKEFMTK